MNGTAIVGEGLGKEYRRGVAQGGGLRHSLDRFLRSPLAPLRREKQETFWALKDVALEVHEGEVLGLIGRNGAGKTTLLKILSRITRPTTGWAEIHGRVGSLLEVGTGFHPELTGRENTFLSGAILGMGKQEIERKFDEIVAFAELEKFIDTPVKHYSSGMYVRLAFAVAAHLEPEILLVDEVLAVGDINFQKKCLGKMGDVARVGRTVVLVSHQLNQIRRLCSRVIWIDGGAVQKDGPACDVVSAYESMMVSNDRKAELRQQGVGQAVSFLSWEICNSTGPHVLNGVGPVTIKFKVDIQRSIRSGFHGMGLHNHDRQLVWGWATTEDLRFEPGEHHFTYTFPMLPLRPGPYNWVVSLYEDGQLLDLWDCTPDMIVATENYQHHRDEWNGILNLPSQFEIDSKTEAGNGK
jgi:lipopolysaccharide transport system ATP-binding protein